MLKVVEVYILKKSLNNLLNPFSAGAIFIRQIQTYKDDPRTEMAVDP